MKRIVRYFLVMLACMAGCNIHLLAQEPVLTATTTKNRVVVGEDFQISYSVNTSASSFKGPPLNDFEVYGGPNQSTSVSIVNGNMSQSISFSYVLAARKEGKFTIPPAAVMVGGKRIESRPLVIEVVKGGQAQPQARSGTQPQQSQVQEGDYGDDIFMKCIVNKTKVYAGEQIFATYKIYTRLSIVDNTLNEMPTFNGFWTEDITPKEQAAQLHTENYEGVTYQVAELKKMLLFPQRTGTLSIDPLALDCIIRQQVRSRTNNIWDQFFGGGYRDIRLTVKSKPVKIEVLPLPEANKPSDFTGAVGNFSYEASLSKENVKADEAVTLKLIISGKGNLKLIEPAKPVFPPDIESYDPNITDKVQTNHAGMSGSRIYEYLLIPRSAGDFKIASQGFSYFDPEKKSYVTLMSPEFTLHVEKGSGPASTVTQGRIKEDVQVVGNDIRFIKTGATEFISDDTRFYGTGLFYTLVSLPFLLFGGFIIYYNKRRKELSDVASLRSRRAGNVARKRLEIASAALKTRDHLKFYEEVYKGLNGYIGDKLHMPVAGLTKEAIASSLESRGASAETVSMLVKTLDECEFARYAPMKDVHGMEQVYADAESVIKSTEQEIR